MFKHNLNDVKLINKLNSDCDNICYTNFMKIYVISSIKGLFLLSKPVLYSSQKHNSLSAHGQRLISIGTQKRVGKQHSTKDIQEKQTMGRNVKAHTGILSIQTNRRSFPASEQIQSCICLLIRTLETKSKICKSIKSFKCRKSQFQMNTYHWCYSRV